MSILPKEGDEKEPIGILPLILVHEILGLGIMLIGQRMKNRAEFIGGFLYFIWVMVAVYLMYGGVAGIYGLSAIAGWVYIIARLVSIYAKKQNKIKVV